MKKIIFSFVLLLFTFNLVYAEIPLPASISSLNCEVNQSIFDDLNYSGFKGSGFNNQLGLNYKEFYYNNESFGIHFIGNNTYYDENRNIEFHINGNFNEDDSDSLFIQSQLFYWKNINYSQELNSLNKQVNFLCSDFDTEDNKFDIHQYFSVENNSVCVNKNIENYSHIIETQSIDECITYNENSTDNVEENSLISRLLSFLRNIF